MLKNPILKKENNLVILLKYLQEANRLYGCVLNIERVGENKIIPGFHHQGQSLDRIIEINGPKTKQLELSKLRSWKKYLDEEDGIYGNNEHLLCRKDCTLPKCWGGCEDMKINPHYINFLPTIEIYDLTSKAQIKKGSCSQLMQILTCTDNHIPHIIKYSHKVYGKKLLLTIPEFASITEISKVYLVGLNKIRRDFYKTELRGRPESKHHQKDLILDVLEEFRGKRLPINKLCQLASDKLKEKKEVDLSPSTIRRHYLKQIRSLKEATNS